MANLSLIRELCEKNKITIRHLANTIGREECTLQSMMRTGKTNTTTLEAIAKVLKVSPGMFFDGWIDNQQAQNLRKEIDHLKALLAEKERTINILQNR